MTSHTYELYGQRFVDAHAEPEWPYANDVQKQPTLVIKDNDLFLITDLLGNTIDSLKSQQGTVTGLFCNDTRFLSRSEFQIEGRSPILLGNDVETGYSMTIACTNPQLEGRVERGTVGITRRIALRGGLFEEIELCNYNQHPVSFQVSLSFGADFFDIFEVRNYHDRPTRGRDLKMVSEGETGVSLAYQGVDGVLVETRMEFRDRLPDKYENNTVLWNIELAARQVTKLHYCAHLLESQKRVSQVFFPENLSEALVDAEEERQHWRHNAARIRTDKHSLDLVLDRAEKDIYLLLQSFKEGKVLAAGIPWFSTLFGRDSLIAASQTLMLQPDIARDTLLTLARYQGRKSSDWHEEDPGKILHELRFGEMARSGEIPHTPYYGTIDATPLWLMLYAEYYDWTGDEETLERLWGHAIAAMNWIDDRIGDNGYLYYSRRSQRGIANQGWKDSGDCIVDRRGKMAQGSIALCEVQAYIYAAKFRLAKIARKFGKIEWSDRWTQEAADLKTRFNRDFWIDSEEFCALALDENGNAIDSITSNPGHGLALGIFAPEKAQAVARRLAEPDMYSGWGIRTLSSDSPAYNPIGYHLGSIWPHDNALIAVGLRAIGRIEQAFEIAEDIFDMTLYQPDRRPPELFCGFFRRENCGPVNYPIACSPQAWATGSLFQLLQMTVNPIPDAVNKRLTLVEPQLPSFIDRLSLHNLKVGKARVDIELERSGTKTSFQVLKKEGDLEVRVVS